MEDFVSFRLILVHVAEFFLCLPRVPLIYLYLCNFQSSYFAVNDQFAIGWQFANMAANSKPHTKLITLQSTCGSNNNRRFDHWTFENCDREVWWDENIQNEFFITSKRASITANTGHTYSSAQKFLWCSPTALKL